jgi:hypothetical protein
MQPHCRGVTAAGVAAGAQDGLQRSAAHQGMLCTLKPALLGSICKPGSSGQSGQQFCSSRNVVVASTAHDAGCALSVHGDHFNAHRPSHPTAPQGLPFCMAGVGDLLALFRCISCRYGFGTDASCPELLGAPGRVFTSGTVHTFVTRLPA